MKKVIVMATAYPYTAGILAIMWIGTATLLQYDSGLNFDTAIITTVVSSIVVAFIGFRK